MLLFARFVNVGRQFVVHFVSGSFLFEAIDLHTLYTIQKIRVDSILHQPGSLPSEFIETRAQSSFSYNTFVCGETFIWI